MTRKLATIRKITSLSPIPDADKIELAQVDGWKVVVEKGLNKVGDLVVYFEIDSLLPERPEFEFLRKSSWCEKSQEGSGFRLRTVKLRGQVSQGLIVPIRELSVDVHDLHLFELASEGDDVTEVLGVKKFEKIVPVELTDKVKGAFPSFIPNTSLDRIQNFIGEFNEKYRDHEWEVSLKLNGSSMTVYCDPEKAQFGVCSPSWEYNETEKNPYWRMARKLNLENLLVEVFDSEWKFAGDWGKYALQGELIGPNMNSNKERFKELDFYVFNMYDFKEGRYLTSKDRIDLCDFMGINHTPVYEARKFDFTTADQFVEYAETAFEGKSINDVPREGLVFKSVQDPNIQFKVISNKFLLAGGD